VLLIPAADSLDTRRAVPAAVRADQLGAPAEDVFDQRPPAGELLACERDWSMVVSVVGAYARGSHLPLSRWVS
jgi:hypothetical protein